MILNDAQVKCEAARHFPIPLDFLVESIAVQYTYQSDMAHPDKQNGPYGLIDGTYIHLQVKTCSSHAAPKAQKGK